jgi:hypothetical protein
MVGKRSQVIPVSPDLRKPGPAWAARVSATVYRWDEERSRCAVANWKTAWVVGFTVIEEERWSRLPAMQFTVQTLAQLSFAFAISDHYLCQRRRRPGTGERIVNTSTHFCKVFAGKTFATDFTNLYGKVHPAKSVIRSSS